MEPRGAGREARWSLVVVGVLRPARVRVLVGPGRLLVAPRRRLVALRVVLVVLRGRGRRLVVAARGRRRGRVVGRGRFLFLHVGRSVGEMGFSIIAFR